MTAEKGYARRADIPVKVRQALNQGKRETKTLSEFLVIELDQLMNRIAPDLRATAKGLEKNAGTLTKRMQLAGNMLGQRDGAKCTQWREHPADTVRGWAAYAIASQTRWNLKRCLKELQPLADDPHFGVREWAWMALRPRLALELGHGLDLLTVWASHESANVRRFASEVTRPRGVWCAHLDELKAEPQLALPILAPLCSDPTKYVRDSVGNWLNDAGKTQPQWVRRVCDQWQQTSPTRETSYIVKKALRSLR